VISLEDLRRMKPGSMIVDVSCDRHGGIESCVPTTIEAPTYYAEGILHYAVDHTPSLYYKTFTSNNSNVLYPYIEELILGVPGKVLQDSLIIERGIIVDQQINIYQNRI
jgi:N5-(carboxyethyl)ornithine synthase